VEIGMAVRSAFFFSAATRQRLLCAAPKSYFVRIRYRLIGYDVMPDKFCAGAGTPYSDLYRNFFAVPNEMLSSLPWVGEVRVDS
jgi:hypothetical protein